MTEATGMTATAASGRGRTTENPPLGTQDDSAGGKYCVGRIGKEESAANSAEWSREETEESVSEEEAETTGGASCQGALTISEWRSCPDGEKSPD